MRPGLGLGVRVRVVGVRSEGYRLMTLTLGVGGWRPGWRLWTRGLTLLKVMLRV